MFAEQALTFEPVVNVFSVCSLGELARTKQDEQKSSLNMVLSFG